MPSLETYLNENAIAVDAQGEAVWIAEYKKLYLDKFFDKEHGSLKFVRIRSVIDGRIDDEYRFCNLYQDHCTLVKKGETAYSAGFINFDMDGKQRKFLKVGSQSSMSLKFLGPQPDDPQKLASLTGFYEINSNKD